MAETICFRLPVGQERDTCLMEIAVEHEGPDACASIAEYALRRLCLAVVHKDTSYCDDISPPERMRDCLEQVREASRESDVGAAVSPVSSVPPAAQTWSGTLPDHPDSRVTLTLGADEGLSGTVTLRDGDRTINLVGSASTDGGWKGDPSRQQDVDPAEIEAFGGLAAANENEIGWSAKRVGDGLEVSVTGYGTVVLTRE